MVHRNAINHIYAHTFWPPLNNATGASTGDEYGAALPRYDMRQAMHAIGHHNMAA